VISQKPMAALSVDLDDFWSYLKTAGNPEWKSYPSFLSIAMPRLFDAVEQHDMGITAFVIGEDVKRPAVRPWLMEFVQRGHELANHSFHHNAALAIASREVINEELQAVEQVVGDEFNVKMVGYRGPSFSYSSRLLEVLAERGYSYDASTFPTFLGPLARYYHRMVSRKKDKEGAGSDQLFGSWQEGFRSLKPYMWNLSSGGLVELPTTTMPYFRLPIHGTYLHFLADISESLAILYFRIALILCRLNKASPVFLLHASDFLGNDDLEDSSVIPGMKRSAKQKVQFMHRVFFELSSRFEIVNMRDLAQAKSEAASQTRVNPPV